MSGSRPACLDASLSIGCGATLTKAGDGMEEPSLKVAKWTDWFNRLERRMGSGLIPQLAQNGVIGCMSRRKVRVDSGAAWRD